MYMEAKTYVAAPCHLCRGMIRFVSTQRCVACSRRYQIQNRRTRVQRDAMRGKPCAICALPMAQPCFDEKTATGQFRGWLCHDCNRGLGFFRDSAAMLHRAADYLDFANAQKEGYPP